MGKVRNGFIKGFHYFCLISLFSMGLIAIIGSGGGGGGGGGTNGTAPKITDANIYDSNWIETYSFTIGEDANFAIYASDPDLDIESCEISEYYPADSTTPYNGPVSMALPSQSQTDVFYYNIDPLEVTGPAGSWRIEFQIIDAKGNQSNIFKVYVSVN
jgi:hypothetical protein